MRATEPTTAAGGGAAATDPKVLAQAGLVHSTDEAPGYRRRRCGRGFSYVDERGRTLRDRGELERIRSLAIPPAYTDVWICPDARGHMQASGRDARGRKQYRYHPDWRTLRDEMKFDRMVPFGHSLDDLRRQVGDDLARPGTPREKVLAAVVTLLQTTLIRVGNEEYARTNGSYGLTTLRDDHVRVNGHHIEFVFPGKSGRSHRVDVRDARLARIVRRCAQLPGQQLFQYVGDSGELHTVESGDVNAYLRECCRGDFTAKDFRTWMATLLASSVLATTEVPASDADARRAVREAVEATAHRLGNTPAVARASYIPRCWIGTRAASSRSAGRRGRAGPPAGSSSRSDASCTCWSTAGIRAAPPCTAPPERRVSPGAGSGARPS